MRIGLIADIHGNLIALDTVLVEIDRAGVDALVCLGDVAALGPDPAGVIARLRERGCPVLMGNTDAWLLDLDAIDQPGPQSPHSQEVGRWCAEQLSDADRAYVRSFVPTFTQPLGDGTTLLCFHGSPRSYLEVIAATTPAADLDALFAGVEATVLVGGHTHIQMVRRHGDAHIINVGSVGLPGVNAGSRELPRNRDVRWAEYGIVGMEAGHLSIELRRTPLDVAAMRARATASGMPYPAWWSSRWEHP